MNISVLGSGGWGLALSILLDKNGHNVKVWSAFEQEIMGLRQTRQTKLLEGVVIPETISFTADLEQAVLNCDAIIIAVPSHVVKSVCKNLSKFLLPEIIINVAKGFDEETGKRLSEVIKEELNIKYPIVLSGPTHAEEVARGIPTTIVAACEDLTFAEKVQDLFMSPIFRVYTNSDVIGVEVSGALKNVIALCAGISDGIGFGDNTKAALMTRGMAEIIRLGLAMGGKKETFSGLTGIGDLIVTCTSMHSRNRRAGILIGQGKSAEQAKEEVGMAVEGIKTCLSAYNLKEKYNVEMPIVETAYQVLYHNKNAKEAVTELMSRNKKHE